MKFFLSISITKLFISVEIPYLLTPYRAELWVDVYFSMIPRINNLTRSVTWVPSYFLMGTSNSGPSFFFFHAVSIIGKQEWLPNFQNHSDIVVAV